MEIVVALIVFGLILLFVEVLLPGFVAGTIGVLCLAGAVYFGYREFGVPTGHYILFLVVFVLIMAVILWLRYFPKSRIARPFVSHSSVGEIRTERPDLLGKSGEAYTTLRPSGTAMIDGQRVDVVSEGALIEKGTPVKVVAVEGMRVVVRAVH